MTIEISRTATAKPAYCLTAELLLAEPREEVFSFFADAHQLERITPPWLHFSVLSAPPIVMAVGTQIDYQLQLHGIPLRWKTEIADWDPPCRFVDQQLRGPYRHWWHEHTFEEVVGGTLVRDAVDYIVPFSALLHPLVVRRDLLRIFEFRQQALRREFVPGVRREDGSVVPESGGERGRSK